MKTHLLWVYVAKCRPETIADCPAYLLFVSVGRQAGTTFSFRITSRDRRRMAISFVILKKIE